jgi:hypothetical protein
VRSLNRVTRWVAGKLLLNAVRIVAHKRLTPLMQ